MFEQSFVSGTARTRKAGTMVVSITIQGLLVVAGLVIPLMNPELLPSKAWVTQVMSPPPPPPPPSPAPAIVRASRKVVPKQFNSGVLTAPRVIPLKVVNIIEEEFIPTTTGSGVVGGVPNGVLGSPGVIRDIVGLSPTFSPPPLAPKEVPKAKVVQRITVGGNVQQALLINQPRPSYPPLAKQARISGSVRFTAIIGRDGTIQNLNLVSGHPLLVSVAQEAVKQWRYKPTLLNGEPVEVVTQIEVNFTLNQ